VFCDSAEKLISLHDKWAFYNYLSKAALKAPHTVLAEQADKNFEVAHIIKPRFSRFASKVKCTNILPDTMADKRHIVQDFVKGKQICSYALVQDGKIAAQCVYEPVLTAGKGAGILLKKIRHPQAEEISARISKDFSFSGQIAFDFIETAAKELYVIECNPRATNGLAFLGADFAQIIAGENKIKIYVPSALISRLAVWCYAILQPLKTIKARALSSRAADFISFKKDTLAWLAQLPVVFCWLLKGIRYGGPTAASTADIEFNGEDFL